MGIERGEPERDRVGVVAVVVGVSTNGGEKLVPI